MTEEPLLLVVEVAWVLPELGTWSFGVETPLDGLESGACWMSLPCSEMSAGPSLTNCLRSWGIMWLRMRSLTGALELASVYISMSN